MTIGVAVIGAGMAGRAHAAAYRIAPTLYQSTLPALRFVSIGDVAVAPSNPDIVWVGTGEANLFRASMAGVGIYKSTDGARTFTHSGLTDTQTIARIVVHPTNPDLV